MNKKTLLELAERSKREEEAWRERCGIMQASVDEDFLHAIKFLAEDVLKEMATENEENFHKPHIIISNQLLTRISCMPSDYYAANTPILDYSIFREGEYHYRDSRKIGRGPRKGSYCFSGKIQPKDICKFLRREFPDFKFSYKKDKIFVCLKK